jgi:hypothetical protein
MSSRLTDRDALICASRIRALMSVSKARYPLAGTAVAPMSCDRSRLSVGIYRGICCNVTAYYSLHTESDGNINFGLPFRVLESRTRGFRGLEGRANLSARRTRTHRASSDGVACSRGRRGGAHDNTHATSDIWTLQATDPRAGPTSMRAPPRPKRWPALWVLRASYPGHPVTQPLRCWP